MGEAGVGLFGKLTSHGDFVSRRLAPSFVASWDAWLQACLLGSRTALGQGWLDIYLTSPIWRFALAPGVCDHQAWAGVLMPSVDRVGRHFPLTLAAASAGGLPLRSWLEEQGGWFEQLEDLALSSLAERFDFDRFDAALQACTPLDAAPSVAASGALGVRVALEGVAAVGDACAALEAAALQGQSLWWTDGSDRVEPCVLLLRGLPAPAAFTRMLAGE